MVELALRDVRWSQEQGHPVLVLGVDGQPDGAVSIALSPGDAQVLAANPAQPAYDRLRLLGLIEALLGAIEGCLGEVRLHLDPGMGLAAELCIDTAEREFALPANVADAIALAVRAHAPVRISEIDLRWINAVHGAPEERSRPDPAESRLAAAVHAFIESLRLDDLRGPSAPGSQRQEM